MLNALQQSEENHGVATLDTGAKRRVLNALRQSEENHSPCMNMDNEKKRCSTPYGNQRKITSVLSIDPILT